MASPAQTDRAAERIRRARLTSLTSFVVHGTTIATGLVSVPLTVGYLGTELYGVWITLGTLLMWLSVADLGFGGNALINALAEAHGRDDRGDARELVSTAFWTLSAFAAVVALLFLVVEGHVPWARVFGVSATVPVSDLRVASGWAFLGFVLTFPLGVVTAAYYGHQEGYISNLWSATGSLASLLALFAVTRTRGGLPMLVAALWGVRVLVTAISAVHLFGRHRPWLRPTPGHATRRGLRRLVGLGAKYLVAQLAGIGQFQSQPIIVAQVLGAAQVGVFGIAYRLFTLPLLFVQVLSQPLMPAYGEARARGDWVWIRGTLGRTFRMATGVSAALALVLGLCAERVIALWAGAQMVPPRGLVVALALYVFVAGAVTPASVMLYGVERVGGQAAFAALNAVVTVGLGIWLTKAWGLTGMGVAVALAFALVNPMAQVILVRQAFRDQQVAAGGAPAW
jgi:O-antigen/teichoic acid export membrane protein